MPTPWWRNAVIYQIYPRSWADADGDGVGDLAGITGRLPHVRKVGVDAIWLSPFYVSPQNDAGYDVADYRDIDPLFGSLDDFDAMLATAHDLGIRVIVDLVPNHSSTEHAWFKAALASPPGSPERDRYIFRDSPAADGSAPPNNWESVFGGAAWQRVGDLDEPGHPDGHDQWYLHIFDVTQADLNWNNPQVRAEFEDILRFWLDRGVDGFRVDVAHGMIKAEGLPDAPEGFDLQTSVTRTHPMWDQAGVHEIYREWRRVVEEYAVPGEDRDRILCAEAWVLPEDALARYVRSDEMHQSFNFGHLASPWLIDEQRASIRDSLAQTDAVDAPQTWVLSNHDVVRHASRLGLPQTPGREHHPGIGPNDPQPDAEVGLRRARAATALILALPGCTYVYQGEELGLPDATMLADDARQDPRFLNTGGADVGRDGCRVPVPWERDRPAFGFNDSGESWLPQPSEYGDFAPDQQWGVDGSTLEFYRAALEVRRERRLGLGSISWTDDGSASVLSFDASPSDGPTTRVMVNFGEDPIALPARSSVVLTSGPLTDDGLLPSDTTVWLA